MTKIAGEMESLPDGEALKIPLDGINVSLSNFRSALTRAMNSRGIKTATYCDGKDFFIWKRTAQTSRYERKPRRNR